MHSLNEDDAVTFATPLDFRVADVCVRVEAPPRLLTLLNTTLSNVPRFGSPSAPDLTISVLPHDDVWAITGVDGGRTFLTTQSALPQVGGAVVSRAVSDVAARSGYRTMRATVVERAGLALAMIGDDWESAITLAAHLHGRGWRYVGCDHALFEPATNRMLGIEKSMYVNASSISQLPTRYRRAVEASPWYVTPRGISFYAVDPTAAGMPQTWAPNAVLAGVVVIDGAMAEGPSLEAFDRKRLREDRFAKLDITTSGVGVAVLRIGGCVDTVDLIEQWFASMNA